MRLTCLAPLISFLIFANTAVHAARVEKSAGLGMAYFSGNESSYLAPELAPTVSFAANMLYRRLNIVNHFEFAYFMGGKNFGGSHGTYSGFAGNYHLGFKLNLAKENVQPYLQVGPALGMFIASLASGGNNVSKNQTSMKYGYSIGTGFDWLASGARGDGNGWGMGFSYFSYFPSPALFEFPNAKVGAQGIKIEFRRLFGQSR